MQPLLACECGHCWTAFKFVSIRLFSFSFIVLYLSVYVWMCECVCFVGGRKKEQFTRARERVSVTSSVHQSQLSRSSKSRFYCGQSKHMNARKWRICLTIYYHYERALLCQQWPQQLQLRLASFPSSFFPLLSRVYIKIAHSLSPASTRSLQRPFG